MARNKYNWRLLTTKTKMVIVSLHDYSPFKKLKLMIYIIFLGKKHVDQKLNFCFPETLFLQCPRVCRS